MPVSQTEWIWLFSYEYSLDYMQNLLFLYECRKYVLTIYNDLNLWEKTSNQTPISQSIIIKHITGHAHWRGGRHAENWETIIQIQSKRKNIDICWNLGHSGGEVKLFFFL